MRGQLLIAIALLSGCGGDDSGGGSASGGAAARPAPRKAVKGGALVPRTHIEDLVPCAPPEKSTGPACTPAGSAAQGAGDCDPGTWCLQVGAAYSCEKCPERDAIRHQLMDRDFVEDQSRDPFFNFVIMPNGVGDNSTKTKPDAPLCKRRDQYVATNYSYQDLKLIGIVSLRAQRKVMMTDSAGHGYIIKRGDCVGKEKAVVKDITGDYIMFTVEEDPQSKRPAQETTVQLHATPPNAIDAPPDIPPETTAPPIIAPPPAGGGLGASTTTPQVVPPRSSVPIVLPGAH